MRPGMASSPLLPSPAPPSGPGGGVPLLISSMVMGRYSSSTGPVGGVGGRLLKTLGLVDPEPLTAPLAVVAAVVAVLLFLACAVARRPGNGFLRKWKRRCSTASRAWAVSMFSSTLAMGM